MRSHLITLSAILCSLMTSHHAARLPYIVGGVDVQNPARWPFMGSLQLFERHNCGCSLIGDRWVATAAHCLIAPAHAMHVQFGLLNAEDEDVENKGQLSSAKVEKIIRHPDYLVGSGHMPNDIALLYTATPVEHRQNPYVNLIPLATAADNYAGKTCFTMGWGSRTGKIVDPNYPDYLQEARVSVMSRDGCQSELAEKHAEGHVCTRADDYSSCQGDSGGPLVCDVTGTGSWVLVGLTSWGDLRCSPEVVSVFTSVARNEHWIQQEMGLKRNE